MRDRRCIQRNAGLAQQSICRHLLCRRDDAKESNSVVTPCGLHSGLRQSGTGLWPGFYGLAEARPFRSLPQHSVCTIRLRSGRRGLQVVCADDRASTNKLQVSPLRRLKAPPSVEMTRCGWVEKGDANVCGTLSIVTSDAERETNVCDSLGGITSAAKAVCCYESLRHG